MFTVTDNADAVQRHVEVLADGIGPHPAKLYNAALVVYEHTRERFDSWGAGDWPPLAESTVIRKESQGYAEPQRPLYAEGNLYESATSPHGPYSNLIELPDQIILQVDWEEGGWQIPVLLSAGTEGEGGNLPARPIWPPADDPSLIADVREALKG